MAYSYSSTVGLKLLWVRIRENAVFRVAAV